MRNAMMYTLEEAQNQLAVLLAEAEQGKEVVIERVDKPAVRLAVTELPEPATADGKRMFCQYAGQFVYSNEWWKPVETDEELREYGFDIMIDDGKPDELAS
jgi:antitoxin (DNA-binding transcriptional repressor) of toxin-antitoxin stability system